MFNDQGVSLSVRPLDCTELTCCTITITINIGCCFLIQYLSDYLSIIYLFHIDGYFGLHSATTMYHYNDHKQCCFLIHYLSDYLSIVLYIQLSIGHRCVLLVCFMIKGASLSVITLDCTELSDYVSIYNEPRLTLNWWSKLWLYHTSPQWIKNQKHSKNKS